MPHLTRKCAWPYATTFYTLENSFKRKNANCTTNLIIILPVSGFALSKLGIISLSLFYTTSNCYFCDKVRYGWNLNATCKLRKT